MGSNWTELLKKYKKHPSRELEDQLIQCFIHWPERFAKKFGSKLNRTEQEDLVSELYLALVFTMRDRLPTMYNQHLDWLVSSRLFFTARKFLKRRNMELTISENIIDDQPSVEDSLILTEAIEKVSRETGYRTVMKDYLDGTPVKETAKKLGLSSVRIYQIRNDLFERVKKCVQ